MNNMRLFVTYAKLTLLVLEADIAVFNEVLNQHNVMLIICVPLETRY